MEVVEDVASTLEPGVVQESQYAHEEEAPPAPSQPPGSLTKRSRRPKTEQGLSAPDSDWNKFARDPCPKKPAPQISSYSKDEAIRRRQREKERRELQERNAKLTLRRAEEEAARQQQEKERIQAERKAWALARLQERQDKINRAAEERHKREVAYFELLEKTREQGLLYEKLQAQGEEVVAAVERNKVEEYKRVVAPAKKITARDIQHGEDLHPSLRALQRMQQQQNIRREAQKLPVAFSPKHVNSGPGGNSPFSSSIGERKMPGAGNFRGDSTRDSSGHASRPATKLRRPSPARIRYPTVDRATSPVALPGVEITVHKLTTDSRRESGTALPTALPSQVSLNSQQQVDTARLENEPAAIDNSNTQETTDAAEGVKSEQGAELHDADAAPEEQGMQTPEAAEPETVATEDAADLIPDVEAEVEADTSGADAKDAEEGSAVQQSEHDSEEEGVSKEDSKEPGLDS